MSKTRTAADEIEAMQRRVFALRDGYSGNALALNALMVAWQSLRVAWYAIERGSDGDHLEDIEAALGRLRKTVERMRAEGERNA